MYPTRYHYFVFVLFIPISTLSSQTPERLRKHSNSFMLQFSNEVLYSYSSVSVTSQTPENLRKHSKSFMLQFSNEVLYSYSSVTEFL